MHLSVKVFKNQLLKTNHSNSGFPGYQNNHLQSQNNLKIGLFIEKLTIYQPDSPLRLALDFNASGV
jgi:hypothetical protein